MSVFGVGCVFGLQSIFYLFGYGAFDFRHIAYMVPCRGDVDVNVNVHSGFLKAHKKQFDSKHDVNRRRGYHFFDLL
jgi:hypothetical protein